MFQRIRDAILPSQANSLAGSFRRLGWAGFWIQVVFGSLPALVMAYYFIFSQMRATSRGGVPFVEYLTVINLLLLAFTLYWSFRYTRLARAIADPARRPPESSLLNAVWTGVLATTLGMLFSMIVMLIEAANMLFYFLKAPQGGIPVVQTGRDAVHWVSSVDMVSLVALILTLFAELIVLVFGLWLLFRTSLPSMEYPRHVETPEPVEAAP